MTDTQIFKALYDCDKRQAAMKLTGCLIRSFYCADNMQEMLPLFEEPFCWIGAGEGESAKAGETAQAFFERMAEQGRRFDVADEQYDARELARDVWLCTGKLKIHDEDSGEDGDWMTLRVSAVFVWKDGKPGCSHVHLSGICEEMALAEERISSIYHSVPCAIIRLRRTGQGFRLLTYNDALKRLLGLTDEEISRMDWSDGFCSRVEEKDAAALKEVMDGLRKPGDTREIDYRVHGEGEKIHYVRSSNTVISEDEQGQIIQRIDFDVTERIKMEKLLKRRSYEDTLTGLYNRNKFNVMMRYVHYSEDTSLGVACFDINGLKMVNDRYGHRAGDDLIRRTARHISRYFRHSSYRIGGDEFAVIEKGPAKEDFTDRILRACEDMKKDKIHIAMGYSWRASRGNVVQQFDEADHNMYRDKREYYKVSRHDGLEEQSES